jgi:hypothetical protein
MWNYDPNALAGLLFQRNRQLPSADADRID